ncbi:hypothetical protein MRB53_032951 [Persea americana]|uniref:Uncharacterized protein n=1 Tax=Persea americana TaxID=3435 RepID=A0ACC2KTE9_PERAE|nr:hypothetical protein MRB53_032951 [Persea americana]
MHIIIFTRAETEAAPNRSPVEEFCNCLYITDLSTTSDLCPEQEWPTTDHPGSFFDYTVANQGGELEEGKDAEGYMKKTLFFSFMAVEEFSSLTNRSEEERRKMRMRVAEDLRVKLKWASSDARENKWRVVLGLMYGTNKSCSDFGSDISALANPLIALGEASSSLVEIVHLHGEGSSSLVEIVHVGEWVESDTTFVDAPNKVEKFAQRLVLAGLSSK